MNFQRLCFVSISFKKKKNFSSSIVNRLSEDFQSSLHKRINSLFTAIFHRFIHRLKPPPDLQTSTWRKGFIAAESGATRRRQLPCIWDCRVKRGMSPCPGQMWTLSESLTGSFGKGPQPRELPGIQKALAKEAGSGGGVLWEEQRRGVAQVPHWRNSLRCS